MSGDKKKKLKLGKAGIALMNQKSNKDPNPQIDIMAALGLEKEQ